MLSPYYPDDRPQEPLLRRPESYPFLSGFFRPCLNLHFWLPLLLLMTAGVIAAFLSDLFVLAWYGVLFMYVFDVFMQTASDDDHLSIYPSLDMGENLSNGLWFLAGIVLALVPGGFLIGALGGQDPDLSLFGDATIIAMCSFVTFLPLFLLSGLANEHPYNFVSSAVFRSTVELPWLWCRFYGLSLVDVVFYLCGNVVVFTFLQPLLTDEESSRHATGILLYVIGSYVVLPTLCLTIYARLLGRLARIIEIHIRNGNSD
ncbi:MAG: hypothetical protein Q4G68_14200 [Planctomycetia bacterium]|nr:hypothetical protein [Planctomycetia bacterium]